MERIMRRFSFACASLVVILPFVAHAVPYGSGSYGTCQYSSCGITLSSSSALSLDITPVAGGTTCTVAKDTVSVTTGSSTGYTVTLQDIDTTNNLVNNTSANTIAAIGSSASTPQVLTKNTWGYRVDAIAGFGNGPTSSSTNAGIPNVTFARVPLSTGTPDIIATSSVAAQPAVENSVWYGVCADATTLSGTYVDEVIYTAVTN